MSRLILDLQRSNVWQEVHNNLYESSGFVARRPIPIPTAFVPTTLDSPVCAIWCRSTYAEARKWQRGCKVSQVITINAFSGNMAATAIETRIISQGVTTLLVLSQYTTDYSLRLDFYPWFQDLQVVIWEYQGIVSDTTSESLREIQNSLTTIIGRLPS